MWFRNCLLSSWCLWSSFALLFLHCVLFFVGVGELLTQFARHYFRNVGHIKQRISFLCRLFVTEWSGQIRFSVEKELAVPLTAASLCFALFATSWSRSTWTLLPKQGLVVEALFSLIVTANMACVRACVRVYVRVVHDRIIEICSSLCDRTTALISPLGWIKYIVIVNAQNPSSK